MAAGWVCGTGFAGFGFSGAVASFVPDGFTAALPEGRVASGFTADRPDGGLLLGETPPALLVTRDESVRGFGVAVTGD